MLTTPARDQDVRRAASDQSGPLGVAPQRPETDPIAYTRSPRALLRLLLAIVVAAVAFELIRMLDATAIGLRDDVRQAAAHGPSALGAILDGTAIALAAVVWLGGQVTAVTHRWWRLVGELVLAPIAAAATILLASPHLHGGWSPEDAGGAAVLALLAAGASAFAVTSLGEPTAMARWLGYGFVACSLLGGAWVQESVPGRVIVLAFGSAVGAMVALAWGTPSRAATSKDLSLALEARGFAVSSAEAQGGDARGSVPWVVELATGTKVFVKTYGDEERIADLLFRLWRSVRLRGSGDAVPPSTLGAAVEHEAFAATRARAAGARVPRVISLGSMRNGGLFLVHEAIEGRSLDRLVEEEGPEALTDPLLREIWSMVATLHRSGVAHRDLRAANIVVDDEHRVWLVDFAFADLLADEALEARDRVEVLASTAHLVGSDRAIDAAIATLGPVQMEATLPMVQPLAVSTATRQALGRRGFTDLRCLLATKVGAPEPELPRLARVDGRTVLTLAALTAAVWVLLPQISQSGDLWEQIPKANKTELALAALASLLTYVGATAGLKGSVREDLPTLRTLEVQMASSFTNRVTPAKVGGLALNARWLVKEGITSPEAGAAISVNALAGLIVHVMVTIVTIFWAGKAGLGDLELPSARTIGLGVALIASVVAVTFAIPPLRQLVRYRVAPRARQSLDAVKEVATRPDRLLLLVGGSALVSFCYIGALALSLAAVGASVPLSTVALVYLAGSALASAAPTPGGLGATEAVFAAALVATGVDNSQAVPAVLIYRFVTFWLPILPGWIAFTALQRADRI